MLQTGTPADYVNTVLIHCLPEILFTAQHTYYENHSLYMLKLLGVYRLSERRNGMVVHTKRQELVIRSFRGASPAGN